MRVRLGVLFSPRRAAQGRAPAFLSLSLRHSSPHRPVRVRLKVMVQLLVQADDVVDAPDAVHAGLGDLLAVGEEMEGRRVKFRLTREGAKRERRVRTSPPCSLASPRAIPTPRPWRNRGDGSASHPPPPLPPRRHHASSPSPPLSLPAPGSHMVMSMSGSALMDSAASSEFSTSSRMDVYKHLPGCEMEGVCGVGRRQEKRACERAGGERNAGPDGRIRRCARPRLSFPHVVKARDVFVLREKLGGRFLLEVALLFGGHGEGGGAAGAAEDGQQREREPAFRPASAKNSRLER